jgi:hypothetical protein
MDIYEMCFVCHMCIFTSASMMLLLLIKLIRKLINVAKAYIDKRSDYSLFLMINVSTLDFAPSTGVVMHTTPSHHRLPASPWHFHSPHLTNRENHFLLLFYIELKIDLTLLHRTIDQYTILYTEYKSKTT